LKIELIIFEEMILLDIFHVEGGICLMNRTVLGWVVIIVMIVVLIDFVM